MAKGSRGLPANYRLKVPENVTQKPVELDDYFGPSASVAAPEKAKESPPELAVPSEHRTRAENIVAMPASDGVRRESRRFDPVHIAQSREAPASESRYLRHPPRKQLNLSPETLRMIDELLAMIQRYSGQKDAKASEMFHALVSALYEARERLDLQNIPPRGRWGTPTARAFPTALKDAFQDAIADWYQRRRRG